MHRIDTTNMAVQFHVFEINAIVSPKCNLFLSFDTCLAPPELFFIYWNWWINSIPEPTFRLSDSPCRFVGKYAVKSLANKGHCSNEVASVQERTNLQKYLR